MALPLEQIQTNALQLSRDDRILLLDALTDSLVENETDVNREWMEEIQRRVAKLKAGQYETDSFEDVIAELRNENRAAR